MDAAAVGHRLQPLGDLAHAALEREDLGLHAQLAGPGARELEQILDQVAEPLARWA